MENGLGYVCEVVFGKSKSLHPGVIAAMLSLFRGRGSLLIKPVQKMMGSFHKYNAKPPADELQ